MHNTLYMKISTCLPTNGFSLDELVIKTKELFEKNGMAGLVELLLSLMDDLLCSEITHGKGGTCRNCNSSSFKYHDRPMHTIRSSIGKIHIRWRRLRCYDCGKEIIPLREFLKIAPYQRKTAELERIVTEVAGEQSFRRTCRHIELIGGVSIPPSTAHRWFVQSDCDEIEVDEKKVDVLFADGTGFKRRPDKSKGKNNRGKLKVALGLKNDGTVVPIGSWTKQSWAEIGREIQEKAGHCEPMGTLLLSDGELGISEGLAHLVQAEQRSHWHQVNDLHFTMWQDKAGAPVWKALQRQLAGILRVELPKEEYEKVKEEDKTAIEESVRCAKKEVDELISNLEEKGYNHAAGYIRNARENLFTYIELWLECGIVSPRASSLIERMMREIGRRLKRMAFGWSEKGAAKMARVIIKRFTSAAEWEKYWAERIRITGNVKLVFEGIYAE